MLTLKLKKLLGILICVTLTLSLLVIPVSAADEITTLTVAGEDMLTTTTLTCGSGTAVYDASTATLTLTNATIDGMIYSEGGSLNIVLVGDNTITSSTYGIEACCSASGQTLTITGEEDSTLSISATSAAIYCPMNWNYFASLDISISDADISIVGNGSTGISSDGPGAKIAIQNSDITITGSGIYGICTDVDSTIGNGTVEITDSTYEISGTWKCGILTAAVSGYSGSIQGTTTISGNSSVKITVANTTLIHASHYTGSTSNYVPISSTTITIDPAGTSYIYVGEAESSKTLDSTLTSSTTVSYYYGYKYLEIYPLSDDTSIASAAVEGVDAEVDNESLTIDVTLPYGSTLPTDESEIEITLTDDNATVTSITTTDGGETWTIIVTAEDGTEATYTLTVSIEPNDDASIDSVTVEGVDAEIDDDIITVTLPEGSDLPTESDIEITLADENATVTATTDDGGITWTIVVTAEDGTTTKTYTLTVTIAENTSTSSGKDDVSGIIYVNNDYHALIVNGHFICSYHTVDESGICTVCNMPITSDDETVELEEDIIEETVEIEDPVEPGETDAE